MKRILIIAYYYPPLGGGGILRTLKFIKYLPQFGYEPVVIAPLNGSWIACDQELVEEVKNIRTIRLPVPGLAVVDGSLNTGISNKVRLLGLKTQNMFHPDPRWRWVGTIYSRLQDVLEREKIELIYTTSPPHSVHSVGVTYKRSGGCLPWVADFRDSFFWDPNLEDDLKSRIKRVVYKRYEAEYIRLADAVVCATQPIAGKMIQTHGQAEKFRVITNGFDFEDLKGIERPEPERDKFVLNYTGSFLGAQTPHHLVEACLALLEKQPGWRSLLRLRFAGTFNERDKAVFSRLPQDMIEVREFVTYRDALKLQLSASANCLIISAPKERGGDEIFTGKIFEYIAAQRPILALVPEGIARDLIEKYKLGWAAEATNTVQIALALQVMIEDYLAKTPGSGDFTAAQQVYDRRPLTGKLAKVFDEISRQM